MELSSSQAEARVPVTILRPKGNIDSHSYEEFYKYATELIDKGAANLLIDLHDVPYMSSAGLRALNMLYTKLNPPGGGDNVTKGVAAGTYKSPHLKLVSPSSKVLETLKMSGFDMFLDIRSNTKDALAAFE